MTTQMQSKAPPLSMLTLKQVQWIGAGYLMAFGSMAGQTLFIAQFNTSLRAEFSLSHGDFGGLYTLATLASSIVIIWAGALADKISPLKLGLACLGLLALTAVIMANVQSIIMLGIVLFGLRLFGQGMMMHIAMTAMSRWFNRFRGRALALAQFGSPTGDAIFPFILTVTIAAIGWRNTWLVTAAFWALVLIPAVAFLLRDPPDGKRAKASGYVNPDAADDAGDHGAQWTRGRVVRDPIFWLTLLGIMGPPAITTLYLFHQAHLTALKSWDLTLFTALFPILALSAVAASMAAGWLIDRVGAWRLLPFVLVPQAIGCILIGLISSSWVIPAFFLFFGMTMGVMSPVSGALWAELYGTKHLGAVRAMATSALVFASAIGPGVAGYLIDARIDLDVQAFGYAGFYAVVTVIYLATQKLYAARVTNLRQPTKS